MGRSRCLPPGPCRRSSIASSSGACARRRSGVKFSCGSAAPSAKRGSSPRLSRRTPSDSSGGLGGLQQLEQLLRAGVPQLAVQPVGALAVDPCLLAVSVALCELGESLVRLRLLELDAGGFKRLLGIGQLTVRPTGL